MICGRELPHRISHGFPPATEQQSTPRGSRGPPLRCPGLLKQQLALAHRGARHGPCLWLRESRARILLMEEKYMMDFDRAGAFGKAGICGASSHACEATACDL